MSVLWGSKKCCSLFYWVPVPYASLFFLGSLLQKVGKVFALWVFIFGFKYRKTQKHKCQLLIFFFLRQSNMAVYVGKKKKVENSLDSDTVLLLSRMIKAWVQIDFALDYYSKMEDLEPFLVTWSLSGLLWDVQKNNLIFSDQLVWFYHSYFHFYYVFLCTDVNRYFLKLL